MTTAADDEERGSSGEQAAKGDLTTVIYDEQEAEPKISTARYVWLCIGTLLGLFLAMIDTCIVATSIYSIGIDFDNLSDVNWVALSYTLSYLGCAVIFSRVSDVIGRCNAYIAAYVIFMAFSIGCGFARSMSQLIAFRALQGIGGSGLYSLTMIILPEVSPRGAKKFIGAMIGLIIVFAGVLGPVLGGILTNYTTWRWIFWINGPIGAFSLIVFSASWPRSASKSDASAQRRSWRQLDYPGSLLTIAASVLVVYAFQSAGASELKSSGPDWAKASFIAPLVVGLLCWPLIFLWQYCLEQYFGSSRFLPALPLSLFQHPVYAAGLLNTLLLGYPYYMLVYAVPLRIQVVGDKSALLAGIMLLPLLGSAAIGTMLSGKFNATNPRILESLLLGSCFMCLGCGLLISLSHSLDEAKLLGFLTFCGFGFGITVSSSTMIAVMEIPPKDLAPAQGILAQARVLGGSIGIAVSTATLGVQSSKHLVGQLSQQQLANLGSGNSPLSMKEAEAVVYTYSEAFRVDMITATSISAAAISCLVLAHFSIQKKKAPPKDDSSTTK